MNRNPSPSPYSFIAALVYGSLYFVAVIAAGLVWRNSGAVDLTILAIGVTFFCYVAQLIWGNSNRIAELIAYLSWLLAICAGLALLF